MVHTPCPLCLLGATSDVDTDQHTRNAYTGLFNIVRQCLGYVHDDILYMMMANYYAIHLSTLPCMTAGDMRVHVKGH
jgi:hypothetical protein